MISQTSKRCDVRSEFHIVIRQIYDSVFGPQILNYSQQVQSLISLSYKCLSSRDIIGLIYYKTLISNLPYQNHNTACIIITVINIAT